MKQPSARHVAPSLFPTTVVGSLSRPLWLKRLFDGIHEGRVSEAERARLLDLAVPSAIALQEAAGVDVITDGEWRRFSYVAVITDVATGFKRELSGTGRDGKYWHTVTSEVKAGDPDVLASHARFAIEHANRPLLTETPLGTRYNKASTSSGFATMCSAPLSTNSVRSRKPHSTPIACIPAARAVRMSVFVSPR